MEAQKRDLRAAGCEKLFTEMISSVAHREQLEAALDFVREGDTLVVTRLDRLCRSTADLLQIIDRLQVKGVALRILDFGGSEVDTQSPTGKLVLTVLSAMAQFELELQKLRMREGIERAKAAGKYRGRAPTARKKLPQIKELSAQGVKPACIAEQLGIGRSTVYRLLAEQSA